MTDITNFREYLDSEFPRTHNDNNEKLIEKLSEASNGIDALFNALYLHPDDTDDGNTWLDAAEGARQSAIEALCDAIDSGAWDRWFTPSTKCLLERESEHHYTWSFTRSVFQAIIDRIKVLSAG